VQRRPIRDPGPQTQLPGPTGILGDHPEHGIVPILPPDLVGVVAQTEARLPGGADLRVLGEVDAVLLPLLPNR